MSLLHFFISNNLKFEVLHINHLTRGIDNQIEYDLIKKICLKNDIKLHYYEYNHLSGNFQHYARKFRYEKACEIINSTYLNQIVTAHHRDDLVENILMNPDKIAFRGIHESSTYSGCTIYRPLLNIYKNELYLYAKQYNVQFNEDISNQTNKYKRNNIRNKHLVNLTVDEKEHLIKEELNRIKMMPVIPVELCYDEIMHFNYDQGLFLIDSFIRKNDVLSVKKKLIIQIYNNMSNDGTKIFRLSDDMQLVINYGIFKVVKLENTNVDISKKIEVGDNIFNNIKFYSPISGYARVRKNGDKILINGINKKLSRLMIEYKIPKDLRDKWPVICDENQKVVYLPKVK